ncbi:Stp1/IreP family PP2C-type Ser/Thr phosphatase [Massilia sp. W12]|uniref:Stp1/IreP family PP2C-type Ser/Thr phosphatase n=1 Tax=Massilia sp. W12 TaxID=3126507 RepID=UPI0030D24192
MNHTLEIAAITDTGQKREQNEDSVTHNAALGFVILADGMGGYNAGEVASGMATAMLKNDLEIRLPQLAAQGGDLHALMRELVAQTNRSIYQMANSRQQYNGMGTTLVLVVFHGSKLTVAHLGDSRLYRFRGGALQQITRDHSVLQEQINAGVLTAEQARHSSHKNLVTRALGVLEDANLEIADHDLHIGDIWLLCSDGLSDMVDDSGIATILAQGGELDLLTRQLIDTANQNGGRDNVSVILARIVEGDGRGNLVRRLLKWLK